MPEASKSPPAVVVTRTLSLVILVLMLVSILYAGWIVVVNWSHIGV